MSTYVIGDIHGCFLTLQRLLERIRFSPAQDQLWLVGDLVNRGPRSLEAVRWVKGMGDSITTVLGNHDLHLLARWFGVIPPKEKDTLDSLLAAGDRSDLLEWLRRRPLLYREGRYILVHAGLLPQWSADEALAYSREVEQILQGPHPGELLKSLTWEQAPVWNGRLTGIARHDCILKVLTQLRTISPDGTLCLDFTGPPHQAPTGCVPWFAVSFRRTASETVFFGHWAALGFYQAPGVFALDSNCVGGGALTAIRLEDDTPFHQPEVEGHQEGTYFDSPPVGECRGGFPKGSTSR